MLSVYGAKEETSGMDGQDGISVRSMRLKVLYTFDDANKTQCLARWPHLLDIQTAYLDENTQIGVIELKTCIQAIVSASPELVAQLGQDYTVYAYDYSEYETPLVGQGMLSWVLASASPTPDAPAHQSKTMVTGKVCKGLLGLFLKGAQETLEVRLRLVPVPTVMQSEYLESMQRYRELSSVIPHNFDAQAWTTFLRQNPNLLACVTKTQRSDQVGSPTVNSGIETFHRLLSECSTPREVPSTRANDLVRSTSPNQAAVAGPSRVSTPAEQRPASQHGDEPSLPVLTNRPVSSASMQDSIPYNEALYSSRRGSEQSNYACCDETSDSQPRKRAKVYRAEYPEKSELNIEKLPCSLRVAASAAASVRIHRPTPINPSVSAALQSNEEPVRPPTPISRLNELPRKPLLPPSLLRESSNQATIQYTSPYPMSDDQPFGDIQTASPEESRYQGFFEPSFSMPSSPPVMDYRTTTRSSPALPPMASTDLDSGFASGGMEDLFDDDFGTPLEDLSPNQHPHGKLNVRATVHAKTSTNEAIRASSRRGSITVNDNVTDHPVKDSTSTLPPRPRSNAGSRPSSRASIRPAPKPLAPAPVRTLTQDPEHMRIPAPASDPTMPPSATSHAQFGSIGPLSDVTIMATPGPSLSEDIKARSKSSSRRSRQVRERLDKCIQEGQVPPFCENCGAIETSTWRRAWSKELVGAEPDVSEFTKDPTLLLWQSLERDEQDKVVKYKLYKKTLLDSDTDFDQILLCNPCGLWLQKFKNMRPENRWAKWDKHPKDKKKRSARKRKGPLSGDRTSNAHGGTSTNTSNNNNSQNNNNNDNNNIINNLSSGSSSSKTLSNKPAESSPGPSDGSSPAVEDEKSPDVDVDDDNDNDEEAQQQEHPSKRRRVDSFKPQQASDVVESRWQGNDALEALRRAIQSSPARNMQSHNASIVDQSHTPKRLRRVLFPGAKTDSVLKEKGESSLNISPRRSPRIASRGSGQKDRDKENNLREPSVDGSECLFGSPNFEFAGLSSPTPKRRNARAGLLMEKRSPLLGGSKSPTVTRLKDGVFELSPSKITMEKLQSFHAVMGFSPSRHKANHQQLRHFPDLPSLSEADMDPETLQSIDSMIMDMLDENAFASSTGPPDGNWADWLPSDCITPVETEGKRLVQSSSNEQGATSTTGRLTGEDDEALINSILCESDVLKDNLQRSQFGLFSSVLDSGFFSSDIQGDEPIFAPVGKANPASMDRVSASCSPPSRTYLNA